MGRNKPGKPRRPRPEPMDDELMRLVGVHKQIEGIAMAIAETVPQIKDLSWYGTDELPAALNLITDIQLGGGAVDAFIDACRWATRSYRRTPLDMHGCPDGEHGYALTGAIIGLRANLAQLDSE